MFLAVEFQSSKYEEQANIKTTFADKKLIFKKIKDKKLRKCKKHESNSMSIKYN